MHTAPPPTIPGLHIATANPVQTRCDPPLPHPRTPHPTPTSPPASPCTPLPWATAAVVAAASPATASRLRSLVHPEPQACDLARGHGLVSDVEIVHETLQLLCRPARHPVLRRWSTSGTPKQRSCIAAETTYTATTLRGREISCVARSASSLHR